jgi:hypothetical protein
MQCAEPLAFLWFLFLSLASVWSSSLLLPLPSLFLCLAGVFTFLEMQLAVFSMYHAPPLPNAKCDTSKNRNAAGRERQARV